MPYLDVNWDLPAGMTYRWFVERPLSILIIVLSGLLFRWFVCRAIDRLVRRTVKGAPSVLANTKAGEFLADLRPAAHDRREQRAETMGSLLKSIITGITLAIVFVMVLSQLGADIAPIIASAGVVGVALGFGAQNLVKDFLAGVFNILEDQYGVGDSVDLGLATGVVESVGLRVTRLRDVNGTVWYVRNGEILRAGNQSQNWARTVLDITVGYEADLDQVQEILRSEATTMYEDPQFAGIIIEQPEVWGVERFDKDGAVVRVVLKTAPLQQWLVARAMRQRVKERFDEAGIRIPTMFRTTTDEEQA